ncbi:MAG: hypothetical protein QNJ91_10135, partial [Gammaproteobacteria bacterium]|nr:hypothetical protein [Gammaproteobacteria bacterium]
MRGTEFTLFTDRSACPVVAGAGSRGCSALWVQSGTVFPRSPGTDFGDSSQIEVFSSRDELRFDGGAAGDDNGVIAFAGVPPRRVKLTVSPDDAVDWAVYYPPLVRFAGRFCGPPGSQPDAADVEAVIRCGDAQTFAARVGPLLDAPREMAPDTRLLAALRLVNVGDIARARRVLEAAADADSLALRGLIALKGNERHGPDDESDQSVARTYAQRAIDRDPASVNARLVMSYVEQAEFDLAGAVAETERAESYADASDPAVQALIKARLAELALANQDTATALEHAQAAIDAAQRAADADTDAQPKVGGPVLARAYAVQGFAQLVALRADSAQQSFENAVGADNLLPLARLGLGLAMIRQSDLDAGVRELELAVALDPEVSLYRSYLGKGYFEQRRPELAEKQYTLAKQLDDNDPTPWLYEAVLESAANDPITALSALEESKQRNDRRAVYRSRLLLDSDEAARNANLGQVYQALGFDQLARLEATRSLQSEPGSFAAHRLLTEANARRPRFEIARVSDLLQARLRAPRAQHPFSAQIADTRVDSPLASGSIVPGFNEYSRLFAYDGMRITASALVGSQQTLEEELLFSWAGGPASAAITQYKFDTDGFRPNNDEDKDYWSFLGQYRLTPSTSIQLDYRNLNFLHGDNFRGFDPNDYFSTDDIDDTVESWRVGGHHVFSADTDLVAFSHREDASAVIDDGLGFFFARTTETGTQHEAQLISRWPNANVVAGLGWYDRERDDDTFTPFGFTIESLIDSRTRHGNGYVYVTIGDEAQSDATRQSPASSISATLGVAYEDYEDERDGRVTDFPNIVFFPSSDLQRNRVLPKLGLMWQTPIANDVELTARGAYFRTLKRALVGNQTLEPTSVVGFNQF